MTFADVGFGDGLNAMPPQMRDRVVNARLTNGILAAMASDTAPNASPRPGNTVHLNVECASDEAGDRLYAALADGGRATLPPHSTP